MEKHGKKIKKNLISGFLYQAVLVIISFLLPRLYLENFGSAVNGVLSTVKQIFTYMCLLEAGVGLATTQALYKPLAEHDRKSVSSVLSATNKYYIKTGVVYSAIVLLIAVFYSFVIPTDISGSVLFTIIILNALPSLFSYFVQAKYRLLMEADGRKYVINNAETFLQLAVSVGKILVLLLTDSIVLIQLVYCVFAIIEMAYLYIYAKKRYTWLNLNEKPDYKAISQKESVLVHQISGMVFNNTDIILLSVLCDFKVVSVYSIYNIFFSQVQNFLTNIISGFSFALGQIFHADREKFLKLYSVYETFYIMTTFFIYTLMAVFLLPLIQIYTGGINDAQYTNALLLFLFAVMNMLANGKLPSNHVIEYSGKFRETRTHAIIEMVVNITVSVFAIIKWGICGALMGTAAALVVRSIQTVYYANKKVLKRSMLETYKLWLINSAVFAFVMILFFTDTFCGLSFGQLFIKGIIHSVWIFALYIGVNFLFRRNAFKTALKLIRKEETL